MPKLLRPRVVEPDKSDCRIRLYPVSCPSCSTSLVTSSVDDVELDWCVNCDGVWFDRGELKKAITGKSNGLKSTAKKGSVALVFESVAAILFAF